MQRNDRNLLVNFDDVDKGDSLANLKEMTLNFV